MSAEALTATMEKLHKLHKSLYELAVKKTDMIKTGDMDALNQMLKDEQAHIAAIGKMEQERQRVSQDLVPDLPSPSLGDCLSMLSEEDKHPLNGLKDQLSMLIQELKERNQLNQQLIYQSLQFVNMSMSLVQPQQNQSLNYVHPQANKIKHPQGMFNSKV
ncbi:flagellar protein FlgN [Cytobacillus firmus]|uniref:flagellar protein FlgN n=1 Tax=Cytobacillus firmus TaxID=1399 RepID=UPI00384AB71F